MHIPATMLNGAVCPVTLSAAAAGVGLAARQATRQENKPTAMTFASVTALIFALQMLNYPVQQGTSGHLLGAMLGVGLLGIPFAILSMAIVLTIQAVFFGDGGMNALGANVLNMSLIGAGLFGFVYQWMTRKGINKRLSMGTTAFLSVLIGALACSLEVAWSGTVALAKVVPAMLSVHALIGAGEALLTVGVVSVLNTQVLAKTSNENKFAISAFVLAVIAVVASPLASGFPDGLEWVAAKLQFAEFSGWEISTLFPDYQVSVIGNGSISTILAGLIGIGLAFCLTFTLGRLIARSQIRTV